MDHSSIFAGLVGLPAIDDSGDEGHAADAAAPAAAAAPRELQASDFAEPVGEGSLFVGDLHLSPPAVYSFTFYKL